MGEQGQTFAKWLEEDLERMGDNMDTDEVPYDNPQTTTLDDGSKLTTQFTFYRDSLTEDSDEDPIRIATRYEVSEVGSMIVDGESKTLYELTRKEQVDGGSWSSVRGRSPSELGYFNLQLLDKNANPVSNPAGNDGSVHSVRVRFSVVSPFQNTQTFPRSTHVGSVLLLRKKTGNLEDDIEIKVPETWTDCIPWGGHGGWKTLTHSDGSPFSSASDCFDAAPDDPPGGVGGSGFWE